MAITSVGYERAITYSELGTLLSHAGAQYSVFGDTAFDVQAGPGAREVLVQPGVAYGHGILDTFDEPVTLTGAAVTSGDRWDLVALRRNWTTKESTLVLVQGAAGSTPTFPSGRETGPGVLDDQPIALVRFSAGQTTLTDVTGLRVWHGDGGVLAESRMCRDYLNTLGTRLYINDRTYVRRLSNAGIAEWVTDSVIFSSTAPSPVDVPWLQVP